MSHLCNVLIVESQQDILQITTPLLKKLHCKVAYVKQGLNVVTHLTKKEFDLVLLADELSDEDGFRILRRIREKDLLKKIPVIMMLSSRDEMRKAYENGASDYILKPLSPFELKARLQPYISRAVESKTFKEEFEEKDKIAKRLDEAFTEMEIMSRLDPLTKVYNRRTFLEKISDEQIRSRRNQKKFSLLLLDIVNCRRFNDRHGYGCGDFIIKSTASLISSTLRERDFTARWSGDKFMVLLPETEMDGMATTREKIDSKFREQTFEYKGIHHKIEIKYSEKVCTGKDDLDTVLKELE